MTTGSKNPIFQGDNPFAVDLNHYDSLATPQPDVSEWSETHFWSVWNPDAGVGLFIHVGVDPADLSLWWAQVFAYLPDGMVVADRSWGRSEDKRGPTTGNFRAVCTEPLRRWALTFDGAGEIVSSQEMATRLVGAGAPVPMAFEVELTATMPIWDLFKAVKIDNTDVGHIHHEQVMVSKGSLRVGGKEYGGEWRLDGVAFRDHSQGGRNLTGFGGDHLLGAYFPASGRSLQTLIFWDRSGNIHFRTAAIHQGDRLEIIDDLEMSGLEKGIDRPRSLYDLTGNPKSFTMHLNTNSGPVKIEGEALHCVNISLFGVNTNVNGSAINIPGDHMLLAECPIRLVWPDGDVGYGHFERCYKKSLLLGTAE